MIDKRYIKKFLARFDSSSVNVSVDEYLIEFTDPSGKVARVAIEEQSVRLPGYALAKGTTVPIHVNRAGTKAVFGRFAPEVDKAEQRRREKERRARDEQRFKDKLDEV